MSKLSTPEWKQHRVEIYPTDQYGNVVKTNLRMVEYPDPLVLPSTPISTPEFLRAEQKIRAKPTRTKTTPTIPDETTFTPTVENSIISDKYEGIDRSAWIEAGLYGTGTSRLIPSNQVSQFTEHFDEPESTEFGDVTTTVPSGNGGEVITEEGLFTENEQDMSIWVLLGLGALLLFLVLTYV